MSKRFLFFVTAVLVFPLMIGGCARDRLPENAVRVIIFDRGTDGGRTNPTNNQWTQWIQERVREELDLEIVFEPVSRFDEEQAQVTLIAAGRPPDLMMTWNSANVLLWGEQGGLFNMAPYVDEYLPDAREFLGPDPSLPGRELIFRNQNMQTGQLFSVPMRRANTARLNIFMRQDWLDTLGLPAPVTHEEFFNTLAAFRDAQLGGPNTIPFVIGRDLRWGAGKILESFIDPDISLRDRWVYTIVDRHLLLPGYKEGVRFLNRMFHAGLIDPDFFLYIDDTVPNNLISSGRVGSFGHNWDQIFRAAEGLTTNLRQIVPEARWIALDAFPSSDGIIRNISYDSAGLSVFIPRAARNPRGAKQYLNWLARFENFHFLQVGPEGIVHKLVDGLPVVNPSPPGGWMQNSGWNIDLTPLHNGMFLRTEEETVRALTLGYPFPEEYILQAFYATMNNAAPGPVISTAAPLVTAGPLGLTLLMQADTLMINAVIAPEADFDAVWNAGIQAWLNAGAQTVLNERAANFVSPY